MSVRTTNDRGARLAGDSGVCETSRVWRVVPSGPVWSPSPQDGVLTLKPGWSSWTGRPSPKRAPFLWDTHVWSAGGQHLFPLLFLAPSSQGLLSAELGLSSSRGRLCGPSTLGLDSDGLNVCRPWEVGLQGDKPALDGFSGNRMCS